MFRLLRGSGNKSSSRSLSEVLGFLSLRRYTSCAHPSLREKTVTSNINKVKIKERKRIDEEIEKEDMKYNIANSLEEQIMGLQSQSESMSAQTETQVPTIVFPFPILFVVCSSSSSDFALHSYDYQAMQIQAVHPYHNMKAIESRSSTLSEPQYHSSHLKVHCINTVIGNIGSLMQRDVYRKFAPNSIGTSVVPIDHGSNNKMSNNSNNNNNSNNEKKNGSWFEREEIKLATGSALIQQVHLIEAGVESLLRGNSSLSAQESQAAACRAASEYKLRQAENELIVKKMMTSPLMSDYEHSKYEKIS